MSIIKYLKLNKYTSLLGKKANILNILLILAMVFEFSLTPKPIIANEGEIIAKVSEDLDKIYSDIEFARGFKNKLPENPGKTVVREIDTKLTAYTSEVGQCDNTPCITANGFNLCKHGIEDTVATNLLPLGTTIRIPDLFGDRVFVVRDRMNQRYSNRFDVWMVNKHDAKKFGVKLAKIEVLE